ncbi:hypothetical protein M0804_000290 [Polistes exclamans]|nr:hypothetical protein M0804_000290 [Polistes exclamans]
MYATNESHGPSHGPWTPPPPGQLPQPPPPPQIQHQNHPRTHPHNHSAYVPSPYQHPHHHLPPQCRETRPISFKSANNTTTLPAMSRFGMKVGIPSRKMGVEEIEEKAEEKDEK